MHRAIDIPELAVVRALTSAGPFADADVISVAFVTATMGRLVAHEPDARARAAGSGSAILPETISVEVIVAAGPYETGDVLTLSFVDPAIARIHPIDRRTSARETSAREPSAVAVPVESARAVSVVAADVAGIRDPARSVASIVEHFESRAERRPVYSAAPPQPGAPSVNVRLSWSDDRVRRFVQVTDKLFTVDRLGWYRHALAMRLLVPDAIECGEPAIDSVLATHVRVLRSAMLETLGRPLIAAFMPTFTVTPEWLDAIDSLEAARALADLRATLGTCEHGITNAASDDPTQTYATVFVSELAGAPASAVEGVVPFLIANVSAYDDVTEHLTGYRRALIDLFGQTAGSAETVRLGQMTQPNHTLDDRLWQLVGAVNQRFGGMAVA